MDHESKDELFRKLRGTGGLDSKNIEIIEKEIKKYFKNGGKRDLQLFSLLKLVRIFKSEHTVTVQEYKERMIENYKNAFSIIEELLCLSVVNWDVNDLRLSQIVVPFGETFEVSEEFSNKALIALKNRMKESPNYKKAKFHFHFHFNMLIRLLSAEFFEINHEKEEERSKELKALFEHHLDIALKISAEYEEFKFHELALNIRAAIMDRDSEEVMKNLSKIKVLDESGKIYDVMRDEVLEFSFHRDFDLTDAHFNIALGVRIRRLRMRFGLNREDIADALGYASPSNITSIESGGTTLPISRLSKIANVFGLTLDELCYGIEGRKKEALSKEDFELYKL